MTVVDTTVWIDFFADRDALHVAGLESLIEAREDLCVCGVILTEILQGIPDSRECRKTEAILSNLLFLPMEKSTFLLSARIYRSLRSQGITVRNSVDCTIAAVCIENDARLLHNDRDYDFIAAHSRMRVVDVSGGP